jgi:uncharacterized membrane protein (UPF0136 family)
LQAFTEGHIAAAIRSTTGWHREESSPHALGVVFGYVLLGATYLIIKTEGSQQELRMAWVGGALMLSDAGGVWARPPCAAFAAP